MAALQARLGRRLPDELRAWLARHDGVADEGRIGRWQLASTSAIANTWSMLEGLFGDGTTREHDAFAQPDDGVAARWWSRDWIPFAGDIAGNHLCIDCGPAPGGTFGQVIEFVHDDDRRPRVAASFAAWLEARVVDLETGRIVALEASRPPGAAGSGPGTRPVFMGLRARDRLRGGASLARVRGEDEEARRARIARELLDVPRELAGLVAEWLLANSRVRGPDGRTTRGPAPVRLFHEGLGRVELYAALEAVIGDATTPEAERARRIVDALDQAPCVAAHAVDVEGLAALLSERLR